MDVEVTMAESWAAVQMQQRSRRRAKGQASAAQGIDAKDQSNAFGVKCC